MNEPTQTPSSTKPKKGFFQFRLTTLMIACTIVAVVLGYGVRRYQANQRLFQVWIECGKFFEEDIPQIIATCDAVDGKILKSDIKSTGPEGHFTDKALPLFSSSSFAVSGRAIFRWNGHRDDYAFIVVSGTLPTFGTKTEITIHGHHRKLDQVVIDKLADFLEAKFDTVPTVVHSNQHGIQE